MLPKASLNRLPSLHNKKLKNSQKESNKENILNIEEVSLNNLKCSPVVSKEPKPSNEKVVLKEKDENLPKIHKNPFGKFMNQLNLNSFADLCKPEEEKPSTLTFDINQEYLANYKENIEEKMQNDEPDYSYLLKNTTINDFFRVKMVEWMMEIFSKYHKNCSNETYFRAVSIFHLYIKQCYAVTKKVLTNADIHLSGMASMFLATKYEDTFHIPLKHFHCDIGHQNFTMKQIKEKEFEVYSVLNFHLAFPTSYSFLNYYFYQIFGNQNNQIIRNIFEIAVFLLKVFNYQAEILGYRPHILALCSILYSIKSIFSEIKKIDEANLSLNAAKIETNMIMAVMNLNENKDDTQIENCLKEIQKLFINWNNIFPNVMNVQLLKYEISHITDDPLTFFDSFYL